jgi:hypothetical protein
VRAETNSYRFFTGIQVNETRYLPGSKIGVQPILELTNEPHPLIRPEEFLPTDVHSTLRSSMNANYRHSSPASRKGKSDWDAQNPD